ncbi:Hypothetical predicted protein [Cloeon dipterum]|uniref:Sm domain-containing protein n=1 Tax=Cloeon dipterum TaxID=197152 RepID=A0A8S1DFJ9_9INSE|nr:Hypothetical predicted protein [Cloeon dipterum]
MTVLGRAQIDTATLETRMEADEMPHDMATALRSELAALQYKKERLQAELQDARSQLRGRDQRTLELQTECENLREQSARQSAVIASLKKRQTELEDRERCLNVSSGRIEADLQTVQRDKRYLEENIKELEKRVRCLELECNSEEQQKDIARKSMHDLVRRLSVALGTEFCDSVVSCPESLVHKASELVQETARLRTRAANTCDSLTASEVELRTCRDALERSAADRDTLQRQVAGNLIEIDRLRQDKETLEMQHRVTERELSDLREKISVTSRTLGNATGSLAAQEAQMAQLREEVKSREEKASRSQCELRRVLEGLAVQLSSPARFVEAQEESIRERIRELQHECKERSIQAEALREKSNLSSQQLSRALEQSDASARRVHVLEDDKASVESRLSKVESELAAADAARDALRRDKSIYLSFLERLGRALNMDEISKDVGVDLHTDSLLARAEQLARLESDKLVDKTAAVYQLQRRVRTLREQLQRRDLHLDLLRRKINVQEDNTRIRNLLEGERDEANIRVKKMLKQIDRMQLQLAESRAQVRDLKSQLADATEYKISALERGRKIEELEKRLNDSELLRTRYGRKLTLMKDQVRNVGQTVVEERSAHDHDVQILKEDLLVAKQNLEETQKRENQLLGLRATVGRLLGVDPARSPVPDFDIVSRLQKLVHAQREFANVSRRYEDPLRLLPPSPRRSATPGAAELLLRTPDSRVLRYDDSGYVDLPDLSPLSELDDAVSNQYCTVELRNGDAVSGKLSYVDGFMNISLVDAVFITSDDQQHHFEFFFVQARNIRFITIPQKDYIGL